MLFRAPKADENVLTFAGAEITDILSKEIALKIRNTPLKEFNLINCQVKNLDVILQALADSPTIEIINLANTQLSVAQIKFVLGAFASHPSLVTLDLTNTFNLFERQEFVEQALEAAKKPEKVETKPQAKPISFFGRLRNSVKREVIYLDHMTRLQKNNLRTQNLFEIFAAFTEFLKANQILRTLNISKNIMQSPRAGIADRCMERFSRGLQENKVLTTLICNHNDISEDVIEHLLKAITQNQHLKNLYLNDNTLNNSGMRKISSSLASPNCPIEILALANNRTAIYPLYMPSFKNALVQNPASRLKELDLHIEEKYSDESVDSLSIKVTQEFAEAIKNNKSLLVLKIDYELCPDLIKILERNTLLSKKTETEEKHQALAKASRMS